MPCPCLNPRATRSRTSGDVHHVLFSAHQINASDTDAEKKRKISFEEKFRPLEMDG
jgi:hypothetical protein